MLPMAYLLLKWIHILSATILFGTGFGSAFYMYVANRQKNISEIYFATRHVVIVDLVFVAPAVIIQLITGIGLVQTMGYAWTDPWIMWGLALYFFAGACWLPVVWMQIRMRDIAKSALETGEPLPGRYWKMERWWIILGSLAFPAIIVVFWLMVSKPV
jgi:uncharacterized membrane protein